MAGRIVLTREQLEELTERYNELINLVNTLSQNLAVINTAINEYTNARAVLEQLTKGGVNEPYVTIGGGIYVRVDPKDTQKVLVDVGEGYVAEMPISRAIEIVDERLRELNAARSSLEQQLAQAIRSSSEIRDLLTAIYASLSRQAQAEGMQKQ